MAPMELTQSLDFLQKAKTVEGLSVRDCLVQTLAKVLDTKPGHAIDLLETSLFSKPPKFDAKQCLPLVPATSAADAAKAVATASLFGVPDLGTDPETGEPIEGEAPNDYECEDVEGDGALFDALGVGLGRQEMYRVSLAVKKLGEDPKRSVQTVRFFGKFLGLSAEYYVYETTLKENPEMPEAEEGQVPYEPYGEGVNQYVYFVSNYLGGPLAQLPYVTPDQIKAARRIKHFLTGKLAAPVSSYPVFPGSEAHYLRAQIARIAATAVCCPVEFFVAEEDGALTKNEEFKPLTGRQMSMPVNWAHRYPHIKKQGRCLTFKRELQDDVEEGKEDAFYTEEEKETGPEPLSILEKDATLEGKAAAWTPLNSSISENTKYQIGGVRSNLWPGAFSACQGDHFSNIYVGWGIKNVQFAPAPPPALAAEYTEALVESTELPPKPAPPGEEEDE